MHIYGLDDVLSKSRIIIVIIVNMVYYDLISQLKKE